VQLSLSDGKPQEALNYINDGEKDDCEHNEGRRRNDYELCRGQVLVKCGDIGQASAVFDRLVARAPTDLRYLGNAAEAMLTARLAERALKFAEQGLAQARKENNRDQEGYFLELTAAAKKQGT
jgi:hypothetical protein